MAGCRSGGGWVLAREPPETRQVAEGRQAGTLGGGGLLLAAAERLTVPVGAAGVAEPAAIGGTERLYGQRQVELLPHGVGESKPVVLNEGHVHVRSFEGALPAGQVGRIGTAGQVHEIEFLVHGKRHRTETADALEAQRAGEARQEPEAGALHPVEFPIETEFADDLESSAGKAQCCLVRGDGHPGAPRRDRRQVDNQGGGVVGRGQGRRILPFRGASAGTRRTA